MVLNEDKLWICSKQAWNQSCLNCSDLRWKCGNHSTKKIFFFISGIVIMWLLSTNMKIISKIKRGIGEEVSKTTIIYSLIGEKRPQQTKTTYLGREAWSGTRGPSWSCSLGRVGVTRNLGQHLPCRRWRLDNGHRRAQTTIPRNKQTGKRLKGDPIKEAMNQKTTKFYP